MARTASIIALALVIAGSPASRLFAAGDVTDTDYSLGDAVPLDEADLRSITLQVLERNPLLASSPGIKFASAQRSVRSIDIADIVYFPHAESAGIKQAFQVQCRRQMPNRLWTCDDVRMRRYLRLESQDFEVRVTGDIGSEVALALIQATRGTVQASATGGSGIPETAILILPEGDSYLVTWGSPEGYEKLAVKARLREGGSPSEPEAWETSVWEPKD